MGETAAHLCVTREHLVTPPDIERVRWIDERDLDAFVEPFYEGGEKGLRLDEWRELADEGYRYCGIFEGNRICAMAGVWKRGPDVWEVIAVGTKEGYQRRGLAKAVVAFTADYILNHVRVATYTSRRDNIPSIHTAESVGFKHCTNLIENEKWCATEPRPRVSACVCPLLWGEPSGETSHSRSSVGKK